LICIFFIHKIVFGFIIFNKIKNYDIIRSKNKTIGNKLKTNDEEDVNDKLKSMTEKITNE
jgi:hypothetical protein